MRLIRLLSILLFILVVWQTLAAAAPFGDTPLQINKGKETTPEFTAKAVIKSNKSGK